MNKKQLTSKQFEAEARLRLETSPLKLSTKPSLRAPAGLYDSPAPKVAKAKVG